MPTASYTKITAGIEPLLENINVGSDFVSQVKDQGKKQGNHCQTD